MTLEPLVHLHTLYNNPFLLEPIFPAFFRALGDKPNGVLLSYLVLPLVLPMQTRGALRRLRQSSSLLTFTSPTHREYRERFMGLGIRVGQNRELTSACLQYNFDLGTLNIGANLNIEVAPDRNGTTNSNCPSDAITAASKLGGIMRPHTIPMIFAELGIANL